MTRVPTPETVAETLDDAALDSACGGMLLLPAVQAAREAARRGVKTKPVVSAIRDFALAGDRAL